MFFRKRNAAAAYEQERKARFEQSVLSHLDAAYNLARWLMRQDQDAQDMVQEAVLRAYTAFDGYLGGDSRAWFLTIVRRTCYTFLRRNRAHECLLPLDDAWESVPDASSDPEKMVLRQVDRQQLADALEQLPLAYREVVVLREMEDLSYREIADLTEVPVGTVMSRLARARKRLQQTLLAASAAETATERHLHALNKEKPSGL